MKITYKKHKLLLVLLISQLVLQAQLTHNYEIQTNGTVYASAIQNNVLYIGGSFNFVGNYKGGIIPVDIPSGVEENIITKTGDTGWPLINNSIEVIIPDNNGGFYIGGSFALVGDVQQSSLVHILADRSVDPNFQVNVSGNVIALCLSGNTLYVGGAFYGINNTSQKWLAAVDKNTGTLLPWYPSLDGYVTTLTVSADGNTVYTGGNFSKIGEQNRYRIGAVNATSGGVTSWDPNPTPLPWPYGIEIHDLVVDGGLLYVAGRFEDMSGQPRQNIAAFNADGTLNTWAPNFGNVDNFIQSICIKDGILYAGGGFNQINGDSRLNIGAVDITTGATTPWNPGADNMVLQVKESNGVIYASGYFSTIGGATRDKLAGLDISTGMATAFADGLLNNASDLHALAISNDKVLASGSALSSYGRNSRNNLAAMDLTTGAILPWNPQTDNAVYSLQASSVQSVVYAGGDFTTVNGTITRNHLAAFNTTDGAATAFDPDVDGTVRTLEEATDGTLYAGGDFSTVNGSATRNRLAAFVPATNSTTTSWNPDLNGGGVRALELSNNTLYVGGDFTSVNGGDGSHQNLAAFTTTGSGTVSAWNPDVNGMVRTIQAGTTGFLYIGGDFALVNGTTARDRLAALRIDNAQVTAWNPGANNSVHTLLLSGNQLYIGGDFNSVGGEYISGLVLLDIATNTPIIAWGLGGVSSSVYTLSSVNQTLYFGGYLDYSQIFGNSDILRSVGAIPMFNPIVLATSVTAFTIQLQAVDVVARWQVSQEETGTIYQLQRSRDGHTYQTLLTQSAVGNNTSHSYQAVDNQWPTLPTGTYYYRLQYQPPTGSRLYSAVKTIEKKGLQTPHSYAYYSNQQLVVFTQQPSRLAVFDGAGRLVFNKSLPAGGQTLSLPLQQRGMYYYELLEQPSRQRITGKLWLP